MKRRGGSGKTAIGLTALLVFGLPPMRAAATPGDLVLPFGGDGRASIDAGFQTEVAAIVDVASAGAGAIALVERWGDDTLTHTILRVGSDGLPDPTFNGGGVVSPPSLDNANSGETRGVEVDAQQRVLFFARTTLMRYTAAGVPDPTFSGAGGLDVADIIPDAKEIQDLEVLDDGRVVVLVVFAGALSDRPALLRLTAGGDPDPTFSGDGRFDIPSGPPDFDPAGIDLERDAAGNLYALVDSGGSRAVAKVSPAGTLVTAYGVNGFASPSLIGRTIAIDGSGRVMSFGSADQGIFSTRLTTMGVPDASWGPGGELHIPFITNLDVRDVRIAGTTALLAVRCSCQPTGGAGVAAVDLTAGLPDADFDPGDADGAGLVLVGPVASDAGGLDLGPSGTVLVGVRSTASPAVLSEVVQVTATGAFDPGFAGDGRAEVALRRHRNGLVTDAATAPSGAVVSIGALDTGGAGVFVSRTTAAGERDPAFGADGSVFVAPANANQIVEPQDVEVLPDGRVAVLLTRSSISGTNPLAELRLYGVGGQLDPSFSGDGVLPVGVTTPTGSARAATTLTTAGDGPSLALFVGGVTTTTETDVFVRRVTLAGVIDAAYGGADGTMDGWARFPYPVFGQGQDGGLALAGQPDGTVLWGSPFDPPAGGPDQGFAIGRYAASGTVDADFGVGGVRAHVVGWIQENATVFSLTARAGGGADLLARQLDNAFAMRVTGSGAFDTAYASNGVASIDLNEFPSGGTSQGERATFTYRTGGAGPMKLFRLSATGTPDPTMGPGGLRTSAYTPRTIDFVGRPPDRFVAPVGDAVLVGDAVPFAGPGEALGADAELIKVSTEPSTPSAPLGVHAVGGDTQAVVSWAPPTSNGGAAVTGYTVTASPGPGTCTTGASGTACVVTGLTNGQSYTFTVTATNGVGTGLESAPSNSVTPSVGAGGFVPLASPKRFVDSRNPTGDTDDELEERFGSLNAGTTRAIPIAGRLGLPTGTSTVVLSVVAVSPTASGYLTVFPCGTPMPSTSSLNFTKSVNLANTVITTLGVGGTNTGKVCVFTSAKTDLIIDASGSLAPSAVTPLPSPKRFVDSRNPSGDTDDEQEERFGSLNAGTTRAIPIAGRLGLDADVANVVLSVVAVSPTASGYLTVFPCGNPQPSTSSLNFAKSVNLANTVITTLGTGGANAGKVCVFTSVKTDLIIDASASLSSPAFTALPSPKRFVDSRLGIGDTDDEQEERFGSLNAGTTRAIPIAGRLGFDADVRNVVLSVVAVSPTNNGYLTVFPCGTPMPSTSSLNFAKSVNLANTVITTLGTGGANAGKVCVFTSVKTDLIIDASGSLT